MAVKLIAVDLDGTLLSSSNTILPETERTLKEFVGMVCELLNIEELELRRDTEELLESDVPSGIVIVDDKPQYILLKDMNDIIGEEKVLSTYFMLANQLRQCWQMLNWSDEDYEENDEYIDMSAFGVLCMNLFFEKNPCVSSFIDGTYKDIVNRVMELEEELLV